MIRGVAALVPEQVRLLLYLLLSLSCSCLCTLLDAHLEVILTYKFNTNIHTQGVVVLTQFMRTALTSATQAEGGHVPLTERTLVLDTATHVLEVRVWLCFLFASDVCV